MTVNEKAYAKINLFLDIIGRRDDGFHEIISVMRTVSLCDGITLSASPADRKCISIHTNNKLLQCNEDNLIYKSAYKYLSYFDIDAKIEVSLDKQIPIGAGLGGGSSDAAATLRAMNRIFGRATKSQLLEIAGETGSDVSFCIDGGSAICTGRGEIVRPYNYSFPTDIVIAIGSSRVSTPKAYALLDEKYGDFREYNENKSLPHLSCMPVYNIFESVIKLDEIECIKQIMKLNGASEALMSGSGPAVFGGFCSEYDAAVAENALKSKGYLAFKCRLL